VITQRDIYRGLKYYNDLKALNRAISSGSADPLFRRVGRRIYGKVTGRLAGRIFG
jgi:hypothetical protein